MLNMFTFYKGFHIVDKAYACKGYRKAFTKCSDFTRHQWINNEDETYK